MSPAWFEICVYDSVFLEEPDRFFIPNIIPKGIQDCGSEAESEEVLKPIASLEKSREQEMQRQKSSGASARAEEPRTG